MASLSPCGTKTLKSELLSVAISARAKMAVAAMRQSNREPRRLPVLLNNSAASAVSAAPKGTIRDCKTASDRRTASGVSGPFRNSVQATALAASDSPAASHPSTSRATADPFTGRPMR